MLKCKRNIDNVLANIDYYTLNEHTIFVYAFCFLSFLKFLCLFKMGHKMIRSETSDIVMTKMRRISDKKKISSVDTNLFLSRTVFLNYLFDCIKNCNIAPPKSTSQITIRTKFWCYNFFFLR